MVTRLIPSSLLVAVLLAGLTLSGCASGTDDSSSPAPSATGTVQPSPEATDSPDLPPVTQALLTPDEFLAAIGEDGQAKWEVTWPGDELGSGESFRLCFEPGQFPDLRAWVGFDVRADWDTSFDEYLVVDEPAVIADTFETLLQLDPNECSWIAAAYGLDDENPGISYQPAPVGDAVLAWEFYGGTTAVHRWIAVQQQDTLIMMVVLRTGDVPEGHDLTREQVDAVIAAALAKLL